MRTSRLGRGAYAARGGSANGPKAGGPPCLKASLALAAVLMTAALLPLPAAAQSRSKVPILGKISGGASRQAFSGKLQSLDAKRRILNMTVPDREGTVMFPLKKHVAVVSADGTKMKLKNLKPGASLLIYYQVKGGERDVKQIIMLSPPPAKAEKHAPPASENP